MHKLPCKTPKDFQDNTWPPATPGRQYKRAIFLPEDEDLPRFIWLPFVDPVANGRVSIETSIIESPHSPVTPIMSFLDKDRDVSIDKPNRYLRKLDEELSAMSKGTLVAFGSSIDPAIGCPSQCYELDVTDLRHVVDGLCRQHYHEASDRYKYTKGDGVKFKDIRLNFIGDVLMKGRDLCECFNVDEAVFSMESELNAQIADVLGIPLVFLYLPIPPLWRGRRMRDLLCENNGSAAIFDLNKGLDMLHTNKLPDVKGLAAII